jgi:hypothetical protein
LSTRDFASHEVAWTETRGRPGFANERPLTDDLVWGTAATARAISWLHIDDDGFATCVVVKTGSKYWVLMRACEQSSEDVHLGDFGTIDTYPSTWSPDNSGKDIFEAEGLLLTKGCVL